MIATAEGVESQAQLAFLRQNGCNEGQGFLFSKAVPPSEIPALLDQTRRAAAAVG